MLDAPEATWTRSNARVLRLPARHGGWPIALPAILLIGLLDLVGNMPLGLAFSGWALPLGAVSGLLLLSLFYRTLRRVQPLAELPFYAALWISFSIVAAIDTYLAAAARLPLRDAAFAAFDSWLGFDWLAWVHLVRAHPAANLVLRVAYASLPAQIIFSLAVLACARVQGRNDELLTEAAVALLLTSLVSGLLPALGPFVHFGTGALEPQDAAYVAHVLALRAGRPPIFELSGLKGIVTFPSYHASLAVLFGHAHRGLRWSWPMVVALNGTMLLSIASEGGHYMADILGGAAVAALAIVVVRSIQPGGLCTLRRSR